MPWLINASQLEKFRKSQKNVVVLDASWHLPAENRDAKAEFTQSHVAGAQFFDLNLFDDPNAIAPHMLTRDEQKIAELIGQLGITNDHKVIIYDNSDLHSSCRALWMFKVFGHSAHQLYILDGGFNAWKKFGGKVEQGAARQTHAKPYTVNFEAHNVKSLVQMKANLHHPQEQVIDVRHPVRYAGGKEVRANMRSGHIRGSFSFPYATMFEQDGTFRSIERIRKQLTATGVEVLDVPIITMCGAGVTAAILNFVLDLLGATNHSLYDGSWAEWGYSELYAGEENVSERPVVSSLDK